MTSGTTNVLYGVWGSSATDVFAVGDSGTILHYDGSAWSAMSSGTTNDLAGVWGSSATDVFAVGAGGTILHYDGSAWSAMSSGTTNDLAGVWGSSATDVFAVGDGGTILHYDGSAWSAMTSGTTNDLVGVWGSSATDVFAVGLDGTILHYNGSAWSAMSSGTTNGLEGVWGSSATDVFAVGGPLYGPTSQGTILHYDGSAWSSMTSGTTNILYGVWGSSATDVFAVGAGGTILHYDGSAWSAMSSGTTNGLVGVWGSSATNVFAVGGPLNGILSQGTILHYDDSAWSAMSSGTINTLGGVWGSSFSNVFAVGLFSTILHYPEQAGLTISTTTTVASSANPSVYGQSVTFTATVTGTGATGTVTFEDGSTTLGSATLSSGTATYSTSTLSVSSHSITAIYSGDTNFAGSTSSALAQTITQASSTSTTLKILSCSYSPDQPLWNQTFIVTLNVENTGGETLPSPQLQGTPGYPVTDAAGQAPILIFSPPSPQTIGPHQKVYITYNCLAQWNIEASPSLFQTAFNSYLNLATEFVSSVATSTKVAEYAETVLTKPGELEVFQAECKLANIVTDNYVGEAEGLVSVIQLIANNSWTPGVSYNLNLATTGYQLQEQEPLSPIVVCAPPYKFSELTQWAAAKIANIGVSIALTVAGGAALGTIVGAPGAAVLFAAAALCGPLTDVYFQRELMDPNPDYTSFVSVAPPPTLITSLPDSIYSHLLYYEYEYTANLNASVESSGRGYSAVQAKSDYYARQQFTRAESFASAASSYFGSFQHYLNLTLNAMGPNINQSSFDQGVQIIKQNGLPSDITDLLNATGTISYFGASTISSMAFQQSNYSTIAQKIPNIGGYLEADSKLQLAYVTLPSKGASSHWWVWPLVGLVVLAVVAVVTLLMVRRRKSKRSTIAVAEPVKETAAGSVPMAQTSGAVSSDPVQRLQRLKGMLDAGLITQQDYDEQKKRILEEYTK